MTNKKSVARRLKMRVQRSASRRSLQNVQIVAIADEVPDMKTVTDDARQPKASSRYDLQPEPLPVDKKVRKILAI